ncbi:DUF362 domain-containing protein [Chloroflexota bacterium]
MTKSLVSIVKGADPEVMVQEAVDLIGGIKSVVKKGDMVLIKPNCHGPHPFEDHITTDPRLIAAVIKLCKKAGAKEILVGEAPSLGGAMFSFEISGQKEAVEATGVAKLVDLENDEYVSMKIPNGLIMKSIDRPKTLADCDVLISMPTIKTHHGTKMTASLKLMMGSINREGKDFLHRYGLEEGIVDINKARKPDLVVADMIVTMGGTGPIAGRTVVEQPDGSRKIRETIGGILVPMDIVVVSKDPVAADATCGRIVDIDPEGVNHIRWAFEQGLGNMKADQIEIKGKRIEEVFHPIPPHPTDLSEFSEYINFHTENACFGCLGYAYMALSNLSARGMLKYWPDLHVVIGPKDFISDEWGTGDNLVIIGNCNAKWAHLGQYAPGCVPNRPWTILPVLGRLGSTEEGNEVRRLMMETPITK